MHTYVFQRVFIFFNGFGLKLDPTKDGANM